MNLFLQEIYTIIYCDDVITIMTTETTLFVEVIQNHVIFRLINLSRSTRSILIIIKYIYKYIIRNRANVPIPMLYAY